jgi:hypothetical protein
MREILRIMAQSHSLFALRHIRFLRYVTFAFCVTVVVDDR